jgi:hypothetical protein
MVAITIQMMIVIDDNDDDHYYRTNGTKAKIEDTKYPEIVTIRIDRK